MTQPCWLIAKHSCIACSECRLKTMDGKLLQSLPPCITRRSTYRKYFYKRKKFFQASEAREVVLVHFSHGKGCHVTHSTKYTSQQSSSPQSRDLSRFFIARVLAIIHAIVVVVIIVIQIISIVIIVKIRKIFGFRSRGSGFHAVFVHSCRYLYVFFFGLEFGTWNLFPAKVINNKM